MRKLPLYNIMPDLRKSFKKNPLLYRVNAYFKAKKQEREFAALDRQYTACARAGGLAYSHEGALKAMREGLAKRGLPKQFDGKPRIFWVGADEDQDRSGFLQALEKFADVVIFRSENGTYGPIATQPHDRRPAVSEAVAKNGTWLLQRVKEEHARKPLQALIGQMWANNFEPGVFKEIQKMGIITVNIAMDDNLPDLWQKYRGRLMGSIGLAEGLDLVLTNSYRACLWYLSEGRPAIYWPLGSDPNVFYPRGQKKHDVVFVGNNYGVRRELVQKLQEAGVKVDAYGSGWPNGYAPDIAEEFGTARIILGTNNVGHSQKMRQIKLRDFDATMSGALYLTQRNDDLLKLFAEDKEIACYDTIEECIAKAKFYLSHPDRLEAVAAAGLAKARGEFTWELRIKDTLTLLGLAV